MGEHGRACMPLTEAVDALVKKAEEIGVDDESLSGLQEAVRDFLESWGEARSSAVGRNAIAAAEIAMRLTSGDVLAPFLACGALALPGMRIELADGSRACVTSSVLAARGTSPLIVLDDGRTLGPSSTRKASRAS